jgi:hypothetical protein
VSRGKPGVRASDPRGGTPARRRFRPGCCRSSLLRCFRCGHPFRLAQADYAQSAPGCLPHTRLAQRVLQYRRIARQNLIHRPWSLKLRDSRPPRGGGRESLNPLDPAGDLICLPAVLRFKDSTAVASPARSTTRRFGGRGLAVAKHPTSPRCYGLCRLRTGRSECPQTWATRC